MKTNTMILVTVLMLKGIVLCAADVPSATLRCDGVLGNSGEQGATLVRFSPKANGKQVLGMGVACDRFGTLWSRGGIGLLNRYAVDGRLLSQFSIPKSAHGGDHLTLVGDLLVLQLNNQLWTLPITAAAGQSPAPLKVKVSQISFNGQGDSILAAEKNDVFWVDVHSGAQRPLMTMVGPVRCLDVGPGGAAFVVAEGRVHQFIQGGEITSGGWPRPSQGDQLQHLADHWFTTAYHSTLRRFNEALEADPGVVLGGGSGSFIGHLDENPEIEPPRGLASVRERLCAVCGSDDILHLLVWQPQKQQFDIVRRIGALPSCGGLGLDRQGNIWCCCGVWRWDDRPDAPLTRGIPPLDGLGAAVMLDNDAMVASFRTPGRLGFVYGPLEREATRQLVDRAQPLAHDPCGSAVYRGDGRLLLLVVDAGGQARAFAIGAEGKYSADAGPVTLGIAELAARWTTLAMKDGQTLLGAADGQVLEMARDGRNWRETRRWNSWAEGPADKFGDAIYLTADAGRLWVSDCRRHRVLVFALDSGRLEAAFGAVDQPGADLSRLSSPQQIAARGDRAVVFDSGNQRLVKLQLAAPATPVSAASSTKGRYAASIFPRT